MTPTQDTSQQVDGERERLIETLDRQGNEIAGEGHMGWGNTMHEAVEVMREMERENEALRADVERYRETLMNVHHEVAYEGGLRAERQDFSGAFAMIDAALNRSNAPGATPKGVSDAD